jgi:metal-responsive CopG/Arc/MetJ family transcriptional regulator
MKTAISVPDNLFEAADRMAAQLGTSRSELYARALSEYLEKHKSQGVTERLDQVYSGGAHELEVDAVLNTLQLQSLPRERW